jgi:hypothetical protein
MSLINCHRFCIFVSSFRKAFYYDAHILFILLNVLVSSPLNADKATISFHLLSQLVVI